MLEKAQEPLQSKLSSHLRSTPAGLGVPRWFAYGAASYLLLITLWTNLHVPASAVQKQPDFSSLHYSKQCPSLEFISQAEFADRRTALGKLLRGADGQSWGAYISEPSCVLISFPYTCLLTPGRDSPNTLYCAIPTCGPTGRGADTEPYPDTNLSTSDWYLSERPWVLAISPEGAGSHLSVLTPAFETSRSQRLPFALSADEFESVSWVAWQEEADPYAVLVQHLEALREKDGAKGAWTVHLEENVSRVSEKLGPGC